MRLEMIRMELCAMAIGVTACGAGAQPGCVDPVLCGQYNTPGQSYGVLDFFDISAFLAAFGAGCP